MRARGPAATHCAQRAPSPPLHQLIFFKLGVLRAEHLQPLGTRSEINAYVKVRFNGYTARTHAQATDRPSFNTQFWFPILHPSVGAKAFVSVRHKKTVGWNGDLATFSISFDDVLRQLRHSKGEADVRWHQLWGVGESARKAAESWVARPSKAREVSPRLTIRA